MNRLASGVLSFQSFKMHYVSHEQRNIFWSQNRNHSYGEVTQNCSFLIYNSRSSGETMRSSVALPFPSDETSHTISARSFPTFQSQWLHSYSRFNSKNKPFAVDCSHRWCLQFDLRQGVSRRNELRCTVLSHVLSHRMEYSRLLYRILHTTRHRIGCGRFRRGNWVARRVRKTHFFGFVTVKWWHRFIFIVQCLWISSHVP